MPKFEAIMIEAQTVKRKYVVEAVDIAEAKEKFAIGDTIEEEDVSVVEVVSREVWDSPAVVLDEEWLQERLEAVNIDSADLDDTIHDIASENASDSNNKGIAGQITFMVDEVGLENAAGIVDHIIAEKNKQ